MQGRQVMSKSYCSDCLCGPAPSSYTTKQWLTRELLAGLLYLMLCAVPAHAQGLVFALVGKSLDDANFVAAWQGCENEARKHGDRCLHVGAPGASHYRTQDEVINKVLTRKIDGLAVSITNSDWLAHRSLRKAVAQNIPLITFDSDLESEHVWMRSGYVGPDNSHIGHLLAQLAQEARPEGGSFCLMSGEPHNPNLKVRMKALHMSLQSAEDKNQHDRSWHQPPRCPWYNWDNPKRALAQLHATLASNEADVFVSVGAWPVIDPQAYREMLQAARSDSHARHVLLFVIGIPSPEQLSLLAEDKVDGFVSIDFMDLGQQAYRQLRKMVAGEPIAPALYTDVRVYRRPPVNSSGSPR